MFQSLPTEARQGAEAKAGGGWCHAKMGQDPMASYAGICRRFPSVTGSPRRLILPTALVIPLAVYLITGVTVTMLAFPIQVMNMTGFTVALFALPMSSPQEIISLLPLPSFPIVPVIMPIAALIASLMFAVPTLTLFALPFTIFIIMAWGATDGMTVGCCQNRRRRPDN